jgi:hypothetical protein
MNALTVSLRQQLCCLTLLVAAIRENYMITLKKLEEAVGIRRQMEALEKRLAVLLETSASGLRGQESGKKMSAATRAMATATSPIDTALRLSITAA